MSNHTLSLCLQHLTPSADDDGSIYDAVPLRRVRTADPDTIAVGPIERFRVRAVYDTDAESPRGTDTCITTMLTWDREYNSPDAVHYNNFPFPSDYLVDGPRWQGRETKLDVRRVTRYLHLFGFPRVARAETPDDVLAFAFLYRDGQGGLMTEFGTGTQAGNITDPSLPFGSMCDDDQADGIVFVTRSSWAESMGDSPIEGGAWPLDDQGVPLGRSTLARTPSAQEVIEQEVHTYNTWQRGGFVGVILEEEVTWTWARPRLGRPAETLTTWEHVDSCYGFESVDAAIDFAQDLCESHNLEGE